jgi:hypothetical protein
MIDERSNDHDIVWNESQRARELREMAARCRDEPEAANLHRRADEIIAHLRTMKARNPSS